jgi:hypothetical protein
MQNRQKRMEGAEKHAKNLSVLEPDLSVELKCS